VEASGAVGTAVPGGSPALTGVEALGATGSVIVPLLPDTAIGEIGTVGYETVVELSGVSASGAVGSLSLGPRSFALTGNYAQADIGVVVAVYWKLINDVQDANWQKINNSQTANWTTIVN
jgi:expansin (peptidoglycan-binding protein)